MPDSQQLKPRPKCPFYQIINGRLQAIWQHGARLPKPELQTQPGYEENHSNET